MNRNILMAGGVALVLILGAFTLSHKAHGLHGHGDPAKMAAHMTEMVTEKLDLSADQVPKVLEINTRFAEKMSALRAANESASEGRHEQFAQQREALLAELKTVLTPEQFTTVSTFMEEHHGKKSRSHGGDNHGMLHGKMLALTVEKRRAFDASLTDEEKATIAAARITAAPMMERHRNMEGKRGSRKECGPKDCAPQDCHRGDKGDHHAQMMQLREELAPVRDIAKAHSEELKAIFESIKSELDTEEREEMDQMHERMPVHGERREEMMATHFLLLDPDNPPAFGRKARGERTLPVSVYPNPTADQATVTVKLEKGSDVTISILDPNGQVLQTLPTATFEAGEREVRIDFSGLPRHDFYVISVQSAEGNANKKVFRTR